MPFIEIELTIEFPTGTIVERPEVAAQPLKCVDFVAHSANSTWMIEMTDYLKTSIPDHGRAASEFLGQFRSSRFMKDMLMKLYGTHAHLAHRNTEVQSVVSFAVVIGIRPELLDAPLRNTLRDEMARITAKIGPSFHGRELPPSIQIESIETWNTSHPEMPIMRIAR